MPQPKAFVDAQIFDGTHLHADACLVVAPDGTTDIQPVGKAAGMSRIPLAGGIIMPGFVDLQVNGGGGVMFNHTPDVKTLSRIARAHASCGTAAFLPTLITDTQAKTQAAIDATIAAIEAGVAGIVGLHLEGPHLDVTRKGAHDAALIRPMHADDLAMLLEAAGRLPNLMVTLAPEGVTNTQIKTLAAAGVIVALGHSDCTYDRAMQAFDAGAQAVTHLFNAMSQMGGRTPGLVGAALSSGVPAGLIADGIHVHSATMRTALAAHPEGIFLVTDAMASAGSDITSFELGERKITRKDGRLALADGTLAGADLTMARAIQVLTQEVGLSLQRALCMATSVPAGVLRRRGRAGVMNGTLEGLIHLDVDAGRTQTMASLQT